MMTALVTHEGRNELVVGRVARELGAGRRCLVLTERVAHAEYLAGVLAERFPGKAASVTGGHSEDRRAEVLGGLREGKLLCVVATRLADEGLDLPELEALFLVTPSRAESRVLQRLGRLMRPAPGKSDPLVVDFVDGVDLLENQARSRWYRCYRGLVDGALPEWLRHRTDPAGKGVRSS